MSKDLEKEVTMIVTEQERMALQIVSVEYLKSIAKYEKDNKGEDSVTKMIKETLHSGIKKLESAKLEAELELV